ncbi:hypothetical protein GGH93_005838 [Coemansia aciculifera]|nr:hypothetical protein GGH93_005838 [Coemansia aciculifera]
MQADCLSWRGRQYGQWRSRKGSLLYDRQLSGDCVYGRHTRCFFATDVMATTVISATNPLILTVIIKDLWAFSKRNASKNTRDEVKSLKKIKGGD